MGRRGLLLVVVAALACPPAASAGTVLILKGRGWGHGIGMSQWGARGMANHGASHERILAHYYPGTTLGPAPVSRVRVLLAAGRKRVELGSRSAFVAVDGTGRRFTVPAGMKLLGPKLQLRVRGKRKPVRLASPVRFRPGAGALRTGGTPYRGELVVRSRAGRMSVVNELGLERYLRGVVPYEMPSDWPAAALRAQAVVARSYALATRKPGKIFDLHADQRSQVYGGLPAEQVRTNEAIAATSGRVLLWEGRVATTFYHSTSGGRTAPAWEVWPDAERVPYLRGVADPRDHGPHHRWGPVVVRGDALASKLKVKGARDVRIERGASGRATSVVVRTRRGERRLDPSQFRRALELRSTWFSAGVLRLDAPAGLAAAGRPLRLAGVARGVRAPVLQRLDGRAWRQVARVRPAKDGAFEAVVRPRGPARYRLAAERTPGPTVQVKVRQVVRVVSILGDVTVATGG